MLLLLLLLQSAFRKDILKIHFKTIDTQNSRAQLLRDAEKAEAEKRVFISSLKWNDVVDVDDDGYLHIYEKKEE